MGAADEVDLGYYEGLDRGLYEKRDVEVLVKGERRRAFVYVSLKLPLTMETFRGEYIEKIREAAAQLGLSDEARARLDEVRVTLAG